MMINVTVEDIENAVRQEFPQNDIPWMNSSNGTRGRESKAAVISKPPVAAALTAFGWLGVFFGALAVLYGVAADSELYVASGLTSLMSSCVIGGFGKVIDYLAKIEHHLRPKE